MKIFTKKSTQQKIILVILTVLCINFITPTYSQAGLGGVLASPFIDFFCSVGDVVINLLQRCMTGDWGSTQALNMSLSAFLMESGEYYGSSEFYKPGKSKSESANVVNPDEDFDKGWLGIKDEYYVPVATYSAEEIFGGKVSGLDINFINPNSSKFGTTKDKQGNTVVNSSAGKLQKTIATWYVALRNLATVGLLCVLAYVGIRMMLSSTAGDKAKYKQMLMDWLIALCILFFMHYIMSFVLTLTDSICEALDHDNDYAVSVYDESEGKSFSTNLLGLVRFKTQYKDFGQKFTYFIFYMALVAYTVIFTWHYLKRMIMMAFLTIIAPMVAFTYPIDKIGDGKAQAFNMWLKEYVYNALIQPFHLIIYTIFVGSAIDLVEVNILYALVCMGFILPAEKILKKMFGFDRAPLGTMGALAGFTLGSMFSGGKKGGGSAGPKSGSGEDGENKPPRYQRTHGTDGIGDRPGGSIGTGTNNNQNDGTGGGGQNPQGPQAPNGSESQDSRAERMADTRGLPSSDDAIDVDYTEMPSGNDERFMLGNEDNTTQDGTNNEQQNNNGFQRLSDDDVEEIPPERIRTMEDLEDDNEETQSHSQDQSQTDNEGTRQQPSGTQDNRNATRSNKTRFAQGMRNIVNAHGGGKNIAIKGAKTLGRGAKFVAKTGFKLAGAAAGIGVGLASGKGLAGAVAGAKVGSTMGGKLGGAITNAPENIYGAGRKAFNKVSGTVNKTIDEYNGNTAKQEAAKAKAFMKDSSTKQYIRDKMTKENNGQAPTAAQLKKEMDDIRTYANEGITDISQIYRAKKAEKFGVSSTDAAKISLLAQDRKITSDVLGDEKKYNARKQDFTQEFMDKGLSEAAAAEKADYILNVMKAQTGQRHNLRRSNSGARASATSSAASSANGGATSNSGATTRTRMHTNTGADAGANTNRNTRTNTNSGRGTRGRNSNNGTSNPNGTN